MVRSFFAVELVVPSSRLAGKSGLIVLFINADTGNELVVECENVELAFV